MVCPWHNQTPAEVLRDQGRLPLQGNDRSERGESLTKMTGELLDCKCVSGERSESAHHYSPGGSQEGGWQVLLRPGDEQTSVLPVCRHQGPGGGVAGEDTNLSVDSSEEWVQAVNIRPPESTTKTHHGSENTKFNSVQFGMVMFKRFTIAYAIYICIDRISLRILVSSSVH